MMHRALLRTTSQRRGSVIMAVLWAISMAAIITSSVQLFAFRQANLGVEAAHTAQARWAARSGIEQSISVMADHNTNPSQEDAFAVFRDCEQVAAGDVGAASWDIRHFRNRRSWPFPMDEHAKMNINRADGGMLMLLTDLQLDVADAITDFKDEDHELSLLGVERDYYLSLDPPYEPRNGRIRSTAEIELIAGVWPSLLRGEDWNLNQRLDPNENDNDRTFPVDDQNDELLAGWSSSLTAYSKDGGPTLSGEPRLQLKRATIEDLMQRCGVTEEQAKALISFGRKPDNNLADLLTIPLSGIDPQGNVGATVRPGAETLTREQMEYVLAEVQIHHPGEWVDGKINLNTVSSKLLRDILNPLGEDPEADALADQILYMRNTGGGIRSTMDLFDIQGMDAGRWSQLVSVFDVQSVVMSISSKGLATASGIEVEINVVVDRSTVPVTILEYRED